MHANVPSSLDSAALSRRLSELAGHERAVQVEFLLHLEEFDTRRAWAEEGYGSLWDYLLRVLHLREGAAVRRIAAMRVLRRRPVLAEALRDGRLCLSTVTVLGPLLTEENVGELVARAAYLTKAEVERVAATIQPRSANAAAAPGRSSWTTSSRRRSVDPARSRTFASSAGRITPCPRSRSSGGRTWSCSGPRRRPERVRVLPLAEVGALPRNRRTNPPLRRLRWNSAGYQSKPAREAPLPKEPTDVVGGGSPTKRASHSGVGPAPGDASAWSPAHLPRSPPTVA
jgi:hypothetical protein